MTNSCLTDYRNREKSPQRLRKNSQFGNKILLYDDMIEIFSGRICNCLLVKFYCILTSDTLSSRSRRPLKSNFSVCNPMHPLIGPALTVTICINAVALHTQHLCIMMTAKINRSFFVPKPCLVAVLLALWLFQLWAMPANAAGEENPLRPIDTSSPRATLQGFLEFMNEGYGTGSRASRVVSGFFESLLNAGADGRYT